MIKKSLFISTFLMILLVACKDDYTSKDYLKVVLNKLIKIESASYYSKGENWNPGDTAASFVLTSFVQEYNFPSDTTIGAKFVKLDSLTKTKLEFCYDGKMRTLVYDETKIIELDSFNKRPLPFRPLNPPFYNYVTSIFKYALNTHDSVSLEFHQLKDEVFVRMTIKEDEQVEFFGKAFHIPPSPYDFGDNTSIYEIWINKKTDLPYKIRREMSHNISITTCINPDFNNLDINNFKASSFFPSNYTIQSYRSNQKSKNESSLINKEAPSWTLPTISNNPISLSDLKSKVLMIQFTSVSCGPCKASIPFLNKLKSDYNIADFDFIAIESTSNKHNVLRKYKEKNIIDYKILMSTKNVLNDYSIKSYPVFLILDKNRVIRYIINGYLKDSTDDEIRNKINELIR